MRAGREKKRWIKEGSRVDLLLSRQFSGTMFTYREIFAMLLPLVLDSFFVNIINVLTTAMISSSSQESVSAVSMVSPVALMIFAVINAISAGGTVVVAQAKGRGDAEGMRKAAGQVMLAIPLAAIVSGGLLIAGTNAMVRGLFGSADPVVIEKATQYLIGQLVSTIFLAFYMSTFSILRGVGETKKCLALTILINMLHLALSVLFINGMRLDILGTVLSLIIARLSCGAIAVFIMFYKKSVLRIGVKDVFHFDGRILKQIFTVGVPFAFEQIFMNGGAILVQTYMVVLGTVSIAANAIANSALALLYAAPVAVGTLAITIVGQCMGAGDKNAANEYGRRMVVLGTWMSCLSLLVFLPLMPFVLKLYQAPDDTIAVIYKLILTAAVFLPFFFSISSVMPCVMRGAGDAQFSSWFSLVTMWVIRVGLGYVFAVWLSFGVWGVWLSLGLEWAVRSLVFWRRYRSGVWLNKNLGA